MSAAYAEPYSDVREIAQFVARQLLSRRSLDPLLVDVTNFKDGG